MRFLPVVEHWTHYYSVHMITLSTNAAVLQPSLLETHMTLFKAAAA